VIPEAALAVTGILIHNFLSYLLPRELPLCGYQGILFLFEIALSFAIIVIFFHWLCIRYYLTNLRLIEERGIVGKRIMNIWLDRVQDLNCKFGILGRIFGFGDIEIESAGTYGKISFGFLPSPLALREKIEQAILKNSQLG
jgi:uncharacterized membrane protein YdbT with pleckstrin-like domain